jgi:hypothetical protein
VADLAGVRAKLRRADELREEFDERFAYFLDTHPYSIIFSYDAKSGWHTFTWKVEQEPPFEDLALIYGDILGNLRTTLDYLVWQLVLVAGNKPGRYTAFPVITRRKDWEVQGASALKGVAEEWAEEIEALQPFQRFERPELHPLAILEYVNNLNKHRFLPVAALTAEKFDYLINIAAVPPGETFESREFLDRPIVDGGELARFRCGSRIQLEVQVHETPRFRMSFKDGLGYEWYAVELVEWVREVVARFEPAFFVASPEEVPST